MKKWKVMLIMLLCMALLTACGKGSKTGDSKEATKVPEATTTPTATTASAQAPTQKIDINIAALKGPTAIGMVKMMNDTESGTTANNYNFKIAGAADEISAGLVKGDFDIAAVPCNLASVLYNKTKGGIKLAGINTLGVLYIVETGNTIKSVKDLKGKTIYATGLGTTPQYTLNYILKANGINPEKDVTIEYKTEPTEVAAILGKSSNAIAMLPQPYVTTVLMNNSKLKIALNLADEWNAVSSDGSTVVTGVIVVKSEFLEKNKSAFEAFMKEYTDSAAYVNDNVEEAATLVEKFGIFKAVPIKKAIPNCNITMIQGDEMKQKVSGYLNALYKQNPKSIGGILPADDFYYIP